MAGEFYVNAINVMRGAEAVSTYAPIDDAEKFRIEYWALEEAKLRRLPAPSPLTGRVAFVTGAASGIGRAISPRLVAEGAVVVLADRDADGAGRAGRASSAGPTAAWRWRSTSPTRRPSRPPSPRPAPPTAASTSWSTTPACRSPSRSWRPRPPTGTSSTR